MLQELSFGLVYAILRYGLLCIVLNNQFDQPHGVGDHRDRPQVMRSLLRQDHPPQQGCDSVREMAVTADPPGLQSRHNRRIEFQ